MQVGLSHRMQTHAMPRPPTAAPAAPRASVDGMYLAEAAFLDNLLRDPVHRTENPWEANLFVVPTYGPWFYGAYRGTAVGAVGGGVARCCPWASGLLWCCCCGALLHTMVQVQAAGCSAVGRCCGALPRGAALRCAHVRCTPGRSRRHVPQWNAHTALYATRP